MLFGWLVGQHRRIMDCDAIKIEIKSKSQLKAKV